MSALTSYILAYADNEEKNFDGIAPIQDAFVDALSIDDAVQSFLDNRPNSIVLAVTEATEINVTAIRELINAFQKPFPN